MSDENNLYYICPGCGCLIKKSLSQGDEKHGWSDAFKYQTGVIESDNNVFVCIICTKFFWADDAEKTNQISHQNTIISDNSLIFNNTRSNKSDFHNHIDNMIAAVNFYRHLINCQTGNTYERELYLNSRLIKAVNNFRRPFSCAEKYKNNDILTNRFSPSGIFKVITLEDKYERFRNIKYYALQRIKDLIKNRGLLFEIEAERETHNYSKALKLIDNYNFYDKQAYEDAYYGTSSIIYQDDYIEKILLKMKSKCKIRSSRIFEI